MKLIFLKGYYYESFKDFPVVCCSCDGVWPFCSVVRCCSSAVIYKSGIKAVTGGCGDNEQCVVPGSRDCSDPYTGGDSSCTGWHLPWCYDAGMGETEWACVIKGYYCDGPSPTCDLKTVTCVEQ